MAIFRTAIAGFSKYLIGPGIALAAAVFMIQPANALVIHIDTTTATLECPDGTCAGLEDLDTTEPATADLYSLVQDTTALEVATLNGLITPPEFPFTNGTQHTASGAESYTFATNAAYFMLKMASGEAFFKNTGGGMIYLSFLANGTENALRYITTFGEGTLSQTPLPAALPLFSSALALLGLIGWRRRRTA